MGYIILYVCEWCVCVLVGSGGGDTNLSHKISYHNLMTWLLHDHSIPLKLES